MQKLHEINKINLMTKIDQPSLTDEERAVLRAYVDMVILAEPLQLELWKSSGLTLTQVRLLRLLKDGSSPVGKLGEHLGLSPPSMTRVLDRLEEQGQVTRTSSAEDRRKVEISLSAKGQKVLGDLDLWRGSAFHLAITSMDEHERQEFILASGQFVGRVRQAASHDAQPAENGATST